MKAIDQYESMKDQISIAEGKECDIVELATKPAEFREKMGLAPNADIMRYISRIIFQSKPEMKAMPFKSHCEAMKAYVENVLQLTPDQYENSYSTRFNSKVGLANAIRRVVDECPEAEKKKVMYFNKDIIMSQVFPEYYAKRERKLAGIDVFFASAEFKSNLTSAIKSDEHLTGVTEILFNAMQEVVTIALGADASTEEIMRFIVAPEFKKLKRPKDWDLDGKKPVVFDLIESTNYYANILDFYFLNLPFEEQVYNVDAFMEIRKEAGYEEKGVLNALYEVFKNYEDDYYRMDRVI